MKRPLLLTLSLSSIALILLAPLYLSTFLGKFLLLRCFPSYLSVTIDSIQLSWWKGQSLKKVMITDPENSWKFHAEAIVTEIPLWKIITHSNLGETVIIRPELSIQSASHLSYIPPDESGSTHLDKSWPTHRYPFNGILRVTEGLFSYQKEDHEPLIFTKLKGLITLSNSEMQICLQGRLSHQSLSTEVVDLSVISSLPEKQLSLHLNAKEITWGKGPAMVQALLAYQSTFDQPLHLELNWRKIHNCFKIKGTASSPLFSASFNGTLSNGYFSLDSPAPMRWCIPSDSLNLLTPLALSDLNGEANIESLWIPLHGAEHLSFKIRFMGDRIDLEEYVCHPLVMLVSTEDLKTKLFKIKLHSPQFHMNALCQIPPNWSDLKIKGEMLCSNKIDFSVLTTEAIHSTIHGNGWKTEISGGYNPQEKTIFLNEATEIIHSIQQLPSLSNHLTLRSPSLALARWEIQPFIVSLPSLNEPIKTTLHLPAIEEIGLRETSIPISWEIKKQTFSYEVTASIDEGEIKGSGTSSYELLPNRLKWEKGNFQLTHLPTERLSQWITPKLKQEKSSNLIGPYLEGSVLWDEEDRYSIEMHTAFLNGKIHLKKCDNLLTTNGPSSLQLTVNSNNYEQLFQWINNRPSSLKLQDSFSIGCEIPFLQCTTTDLSSFPNSISSLSYDMQISICPLSSSSVLPHLNLNLKQSPSPNLIAFNAEIFGNDNKFSYLKGYFDSSEGNIELSAYIDQLPLEIFDIFSSFWGIKPSLFLGCELNGSCHTAIAKWTGPFQLHLKSPLSSVSMRGSLVDGTIKLSAPLTLEATPSDRTNPISYPFPLTFKPLETLNLRIEAREFAYPIHPNNPSLIHIPSGELRIGKVEVYPQELLGNLFKILRLSRSNTEPIEICSTPINFHVKKGIFHAERTEILIDQQYWTSLWGEINFLVNDVNLMMGITSQSLQKALGIETLPSDYLMCLPIKGPIKHPQLYIGKGMMEVGALLGLKNQSNPLLSSQFTKKKFKNSRSRLSYVPPLREIPPWAKK